MNRSLLHSKSLVRLLSTPTRPLILTASLHSSTSPLAHQQTHNHSSQSHHHPQIHTTSLSTPSYDELRKMIQSQLSNNRVFCSNSNRDWRDKLLGSYNLQTVVNNRSIESFLYEWRYDWQCFWNESEVPLDPNKDYVFKSMPELWECGIAHVPKQFEEFGDGECYKELCEDFELLDELKQLANSYQGTNWHPAGYQLFPIILKFEKSRQLTPAAVLKTLAAHEHLQHPESIIEHRITDAKDGMQSRKAKAVNGAVEEWFEQNFGDSYVAFQTGAQLLNPVPWLCVGKTKNGNLVGFISAIDMPMEPQAINWS